MTNGLDRAIASFDRVATLGALYADTLEELYAERRWREEAATLLLALSGDGLVVTSSPVKALIRRLLADQPRDD